jgi:hypothetical protein
MRSVGWVCRSPIRGGFEGTTKVFRDSLANEPYLIAAALLAVYIVLGVLYESYIHPITILSTLPSAGAGAVLALIATDTEFSIVALIGVVLLIGIVMKNAIIMIDFALDAERRLGLSPRDAICEACLKRYARGGAVSDRLWRGRRIAPSARRFNRRRANRQSGTDALHDACHLSLSRSPPPLGAVPLALTQLRRFDPPFRDFRGASH